MSIADIIASFLGFGLLHLRGHHGYSGWRWLFMIEGLITFVFGLAAFALMPPSPTQTANWSRGKKGWFTERQVGNLTLLLLKTTREEIIMVNRIIREDPSKSGMHNRQPITPRLLWHSLKDFDLYPLYLIGLNFQTPMRTSKNLAYIAEVTGQLTLTAMFGQIWALPFLIFIYVVNINNINKWTAWAIMTLLLGWPSAHPIQVGWNSRNSNTVRTRTVSAAMYNMCVQTGGIIAANIYRDDDKPRYLRGNRTLVSLCAVNIGLYLFTKAYYVLRNKHKTRKWDAMTEEQRAHYLAATTDEGNKRLDFRFAH
ncbi:MAG: hypothetical protein Q9160_002459 [Pyrenula sp. 1 TL-2023]